MQLEVVTSAARFSSVPATSITIGEITPLVIRPDGRGLRADRDHVKALATYHARLVSGRA